MVTVYWVHHALMIPASVDPTPYSILVTGWGNILVDGEWTPTLTKHCEN